MPLKSRNALNKFYRIFSASQDVYEKEKIFVDSLFRIIEKSQLTEIDTAKKSYNEEQSQSFDNGKSLFANSDNAIVKTFELSGDNHGSKKIIEYYHESRLILRIQESEYYINGFQYTIVKEYYTREQFKPVLFRTEKYKNYGAKLEPSKELLNYRIDEIEPFLEIKKRR